MDYDAFKLAFMSALQEARLRLLNPQGEEWLDRRTLDREYRVYVEPVGSEVSPPFRVTASISFRWDALLTARMATCEEDVITELYGRDPGRAVQTEKPWVRVDIRLRAGLDWGESLPMPSRDSWAGWTREALARLESVDRVVSEDVAREIPGDGPAILAWQGDPEIKLRCTATGEVRLEQVRLAAFQAIDLPRQWDDPDRDDDADPYEQLAEMFERVEAGLHAWGEVADHLLPAPRR